MISFDKDDIFLVTGASSGIGKSIAQSINKLGAKVIAVARNEEKLFEAKAESKHPELFHPEMKDLSENPDDLPKWINQIVEKYGRLKGMALSAAQNNLEPISICKVDKAHDLFDINYFSNIALIKGFSKKQNNQGPGSNVVLISSMITEIGVPGTINYSASKGAINAAVKTLAVELARYGIRVNSVSPGHVKTELLSDKNINQQQFFDRVEKNYPLGLGKPEDVSNLVCFLLSELASWITGSNYIIDGGGSINFLNK